jgi:DNA polymerase-3 subunit gamma/tau
MAGKKKPEGFIVSARTFRPQSFEDVVGQEHVSRILQNAIRLNRIAHAYIFSGPRGVGKTTVARILAKALNCMNFDGPTPEPCQKCASCVSITQGTSVDVIEIDGASNRGIDEVRELRDNARLRPALSRCKVFYIDEVHMLTKEAFNALLKILEEPPEHVRFIMSTTEEHKIPETILSRCQTFRFRLIHSGEVGSHLRDVAKAQSKAKIDDEVFNILSRAGGGSMRDSLSLLDQILSLSDKKITTEDAEMILGMVASETLARTITDLHKGELSEILTLVDEVAEGGKDMVQFARDLVDYYRSLLVVRNVPRPEKILATSGEEIERVKQIAQDIPDSEILTSVEILWEAESRMRFLPDPRLVLEMALVKIAKLGRMVEIEDLLKRLEGLERRIPSAGAAGAVYPRKELDEPREKKRSSSEKPLLAEVDRADEVDRVDKADGADDVPPSKARAEIDPGNGIAQRARALWGAVIEGVSEVKPSIGGCLTAVHPVAEEGGKLVLGVPEGSRFHFEKLNREDSRTVLEEVLGRVLGNPVSYTCRFQKFDRPSMPSGSREEVSPEDSAALDIEQLKKEEPILDNILKTFGGRVVKVEMKGKRPKAESEGE